MVLEQPALWVSTHPYVIASEAKQSVLCKQKIVSVQKRAS
jgi:hypothetical protein